MNPRAAFAFFILHPSAFILSQDLGKGVVGHEAAHFVEELADRDLLARQLRDPLVLAEDRKRRADGRDEKISSSDALRPKEVETLFGDVLEFLANVVPESASGVLCALSTNKRDATCKRCGAD